MKKNIGLIALLVVAVTAFTIFAYNKPVNKSYEIPQAGYTYAPDGKLVDFPEKAKYTNTWINNERAIEIDAKFHAIDLSRTLFFADGSLELLGKSVAIISEVQLDELPSFTQITKNSNDYLATNTDGDTIQQMPQGTIIKVAEGRYLLLDEATLKNQETLNKKLAPTALIIIDENNKIRVNNEGQSEEMASDDLYIQLANSSYKFDLTTETLVKISDESQTINVKDIKVDMDDDAGKAEISAAQSSSTAETSSTTKESSTSSSSAEASSSNESQASAGQGGASGSSASNTQTGSSAGSANTGAGAGSSADSGTNAGTDTTDSSQTLSSEDREKINDIINKINEASNAPDPTTPLVRVENDQTQGRQIVGDVVITDDNSYLTELTVSLLLDDQVQESHPLAVNEPTQSFSFAQLQYGKTYQILIEGSYQQTDAEKQNVTFYRKNFTISPVTLDKQIIEQGSDYLVIQLTARNLDEPIEQLRLRYKKNSSQSNESAYTDVDVAGLNADEHTTTVRLEQLASNTEYLIEMESMSVNGQDVTDASWYLLGRTNKRLPSIASIELTYEQAAYQFTVAPNGLVDEDDTMTSIRYVLYQKDDYEENQENAVAYAAASVNANNKQSSVTVGRTANMVNSRYIVAAYVSGNNGQSEYQLPAIISNTVEIGQKEMPTVHFQLNDAEQNSLSVQYEIIDADNALIFNNLSHPIFKIYEADAEGNIIATEPMTEIDLVDRNANLGNVSFEGLASETYYVVLLEASYDIENGNGIMTAQEIGRSSVYQTTAVIDASVSFSQTKATTDSVAVKAYLSETGAKITSANLIIKDADENVIRTIALTLENLREMVKASGAEFEIDELERNKDYTIEVTDAKDNGDNPMNVVGSGRLKTKKQAPTVEEVPLTYDEENNRMTVQVTRAEGMPLEDIDTSINKIVYSVYDQNELEENEDASPLTERAVTSNFTQTVHFNLGENEIVRGKTYIVKAVVFWHDRFETHQIHLESNQLAIKSHIPEVEYQIISRDEQSVTLKILITDSDQILTNNKVKVKSGSTEKEAAHNETVTLPLSGAGEVSTSGEYTLIETSDPITAVLQSKSFLATNAQAPQLRPAVTVNVAGRKLDLNSQLSDASQTIAVQQVLKNGTQTIHKGYLNGTSVAAAQAYNVPNEQNNIYFGQNYDMNLSAAAYYRENYLDNQSFAQPVMLVINNGEGYVQTGDNQMTVSGSFTTASIFQAENVVIGQKGNVDSIALKNVLTDQYLLHDGFSIGEGSQAMTFKLVRQADGSYVMTQGGSYLKFGQGLVESSEQASKIDLYTVAQTTADNQQQVSLPSLTEPVLEGELVQVFDKKLNFSVTGNDIDNVLTKDTQKRLEIYASVYRRGETTAEHTVQVTSLPAQNRAINNLQSDTQYTLKITATYDLLDGNGKQTVEFFNVDFETEPMVPEIKKTVYSWNASVYGTNARKITAKTTIDDQSEIVDDVEYRLYELTNTISYSTDVDVMAPILEGLTPTAVFHSLDEEATFNIYREGGGQNFYAGKTYIIAAYVATTIPDRIPQFLGNVSKLTVTTPKAPTVTLAASGITASKATVNFTFNDSQGYFLNADNREFSYELKYTDPNITTPVIPNASGSATSNGQANGSLLKTYDSLTSSTGYTFEVTGRYDDLTGGGIRDWSRKIELTTLAENVTSYPLITNLNGSNLTLTVNELKQNSATIQNIAMVLYKYDPQTNSVGEELMRQTIPLASYPMNVNHTFDISSLRGQTDYVMARFETTYIPSLETNPAIYKLENIVYINNGARAGFGGLSLANQSLRLAVAEPETLDQETYQLTIKDEVGEVIEAKEVKKEELQEEVAIDTHEKSINEVALTSEDGAVVAAYQTSQFAETVTAYYSETQTTLFSANYAADQQLMVTLTPKKVSFWDRLLRKKQSIETAITGQQLNEGYLFSVNLEEYDLAITEKTTDEPVNLQKVQVIE